MQYILCKNGQTVSIFKIKNKFFYNQLNEGNHVLYSGKGDFLINNRYIFEVGGKNKTRKQIQDINNAYIAADNIEYAQGNKIPLWLFAFLY
ncbi:MAG: hypothetical protein R6V23_16275 [Bacteroidales bacterium]